MVKKLTTEVLKQLLADNNIVIPSTTKGKTELFLMLFDAGILKREEVFPPRKEKVERQPKVIDPKHEYLRTIRPHPKKVVFTDIETQEKSRHMTLSIKQSKLQGMQVDICRSVMVRLYIYVRQTVSIGSLLSRTMHKSYVLRFENI